MTITVERQVELTNAYQANINARHAPYANVHISNFAELKWIFTQHRWSGADSLPVNFTRADLRPASKRLTSVTLISKMPTSNMPTCHMLTLKAST